MVTKEFIKLNTVSIPIQDEKWWILTLLGGLDYHHHVQPIKHDVPDVHHPQNKLHNKTMHMKDGKRASRCALKR